MSEQPTLTVELTYREGFSFTAHYPGGNIPDLITDEGPPLGQGLGPSPTALLATAVGNCLPRLAKNDHAKQVC